MSSSRRFERAQELFLQARGLAPGPRTELLDEACREDPELREEIDLLLEHDERPLTFVDAPLGGAGAASSLRAGLEALRAAPPERTEGPLPRAIGKYHIRRKLGEGGMGAVYEAQQEQPHRTVALKLLRTALLYPEARRRFAHEGEFLGRLQHPGIAQIFDSGEAETEYGPQPYFAMELVRGEPLTVYARDRGLSLAERLELLARVADAVQHAHQQSVIHRDLKPDNILIDESGSPKILDFGIARACDSDVQLTTLRTDVGQILGTLAYMSPEQASGDPAAIDTRSDVYSLGVLLYELLADRLPYDVTGKPLPEAVRVVREEEPRRLSAVRSAHRGDVETIVGKALEKDRERRYPSAAALASDLRRFLRHEPISARPPSRLYTLGKFVRRNKTVVAAALMVGLALLVGLAAALRFGMREAEQRRIAEREAYRANLTVTLEALEEGDYPAAREAHDKAPARMRHWEWRHLDRRWVQELAQVGIPDVRLAAFLDETRVVAIDGSGGAHVWNALTGALDSRPSFASSPSALGTLPRPLALTADGARLLAYVTDELLLGDPLSDGAPERIPLGRQTPLHGAGLSAVAPDGSRAAVATKGNHLFLGEVGQAARPLPYDVAEIRSVAFDPGSRLLAVRRKGRFRLWKTDTDPAELLWEEGVSYGALAFTPDGTTLALEVETDSGSGSGLLYKEVGSGRTLRSLSREDYGAFHFRRSGDAAFSADRRLVALTFPHRGVFLLDASAGRAWGPAGETSVTGATSHGAVGFLDYGPGGDILVAFGPSGNTLLSLGALDRTARLWRTGIDGAAHVCRGHTGSVGSVAFGPDGATLASGAGDGSVRLWDSASGLPIAALPVGGTVGGLAFSRDGRSLACQSEGALVIWDTALGRAAVQLAGSYSGAVEYSPDGSYLAAATRDGRVRVWDARTHVELRVLECEEGTLVTSLTFDGSGGLLAAGSSDATVRLWDTATGARLARFESEHEGHTSFRGALSMAFAPGGGRLVVGWGDSSMSILEVPSLAEVREMPGHRGAVFAVDCSPDGERIASGGHGSLRLWDAATGSFLVALDEHEDSIRSLAFSPDGRWIATGSSDETVRIWDSEPVGSRWQSLGEIERARPAAERLVASLYDELGDPSAVLARLEQRADLDPILRRVALQAVLRREVAGASTERSR